MLKDYKLNTDLIHFNAHPERVKPRRRGLPVAKASVIIDRYPCDIVVNYYNPRKSIHGAGFYVAFRVPGAEREVPMIRLYLAKDISGMSEYCIKLRMFTAAACYMPVWLEMRKLKAFYNQNTQLIFPTRKVKR